MLEFKRIGVYGLPELNEWLSDCIKNTKGVVGISLKQQVINPGGIYVVNMNRKARFKHFFNKSVTKTTTKTVKLNFSFTYSDLGKLLGEGDIDLRTFATDTRSSTEIDVGEQVIIVENERHDYLVKSCKTSKRYILYHFELESHK